MMLKCYTRLFTSPKPLSTGLAIFICFGLPVSSVYSGGGGSSGGMDGGGMGSCSTSIGISNTRSLVFGKFAANSSGKIVISTSGNRSNPDGGIFLISSTYNEARFYVTGTSNCSYSISMPSSISMSNGSQSMTVNYFTRNPSSSGTLNSSGNQTIYVGATLNASSNQQAGSYSGNFTVTVNYN